MDSAKFEPRVKSKKRLRCCVPGCTSRTSKNLDLVFHTFPPASNRFVYLINEFGKKRMIEQREAWKKILKVRTVTRSSVVCSLHFQMNDYYDYNFVPDATPTERKRLKKDVVPSCNLPTNDILPSKSLDKFPNNYRSLKQVSIEEIVLHHNYSKREMNEINVKTEIFEADNKYEESKTRDISNDVETEHVLIKVEDTTKEYLEENSSDENAGKYENVMIKVEPSVEEEFLEENGEVEDSYSKKELNDELIIKEEPFNTEDDQIPENDVKSDSDTTTDTITKGLEYEYNESPVTFNTNKNVEELSELSSSKPQYTCETCYKIFSCPYAFRGHRLLHSRKEESDVLKLLEKEMQYVCQVCGKKFTKSEHLDKHKLVHTGIPYSCVICRKAFVRKEFVRLHSSNNTGEKLFACDTCRKTFIVENSPKPHEKIHAKNTYPCSKCELYFTDINSLKAHQKSHKFKKTHICEVCEKKFRSIYQLNHHKRTHQVKNQIVYQRILNECEFTVVSTHQKNQHLKKIHNCDVCQKKFLTVYQLNQHTRTHRVENQIVYKDTIVDNKRIFTPSDILKLS